jgi:hypothetical protein
MWRSLLERQGKKIDLADVRQQMSNMPTRSVCVSKCTSNRFEPSRNGPETGFTHAAATVSLA